MGERDPRVCRGRISPCASQILPDESTHAGPGLAGLRRQRNFLFCSRRDGEFEKRKRDVAEILEVVLKISILFFMVGNMAGMGAQLAMAEALAALRNVRFIVMTVVWGWVLCPSFAYLLVKIVPMERPYTLGLMLLGMTPCAPFMPMMVKKARGDLGYTGAMMLLAAIGTVAFMPFAVPRMVSGLTADAWVVGKPLLFFVLVPLLVGMAVKGCAEPLASQLYPVVKKTTDIITMVMLAVMAIVYGEDFIGAIGSYAIGTLVLFVGAVPWPRTGSDSA